MASKLDSILIQLNEILDTLQQDEDKRVIAILQIVQELAQHVTIIQNECIKLLQERSVDDKKNHQPPFKWDALRADSSPFNAPYNQFFD